MFTSSIDIYILTFNNFDSLSHSRVYFATCLTIVFNFETKKREKRKKTKKNTNKRQSGKMEGAEE